MVDRTVTFKSKNSPMTVPLARHLPAGHARILNAAIFLDAEYAKSHWSVSNIALCTVKE